jgi:hypothetical protein
MTDGFEGQIEIVRRTRGYLNQIGLSPDAIVFVTSAPPEGMEWLTAEKGGDVGIAYDVLAREMDVTQPLDADGSTADPMEIKLLPPRLLKPGDQVRVAAGPFAQFVAEIETIAPDRRVWVLMEIMGGQTRVAVKADQLRIVGA